MELHSVTEGAETQSVFTLVLEKYIEIEARISNIVFDTRVEKNKRHIDIEEALRLRALLKEKRELMQMIQAVADDIDYVRVCGSALKTPDGKPVQLHALVFVGVFGCATIHVYPFLSWEDHLSWVDVDRKTPSVSEGNHE